MKTELNSKDYVTFARRFVKETVATMDIEELIMSAISTDGMDKWLDDAYPDLDRRKANMIYEIASLIKDDPDTAPVLIEELVDIMFDEQIDHLEDVIVNHFGVEVYPE